MNDIIAMVAKYLKKRNIFFTEGKDECTLMVKSSIDESILLTIVIADNSLFSISACFPNKVPAMRRNAIGELFMQVNCSQRAAVFALNYKSGQAICRISVPIDENEISEEELISLYTKSMHKIVYLVNNLYDSFMKVAFGNATASIGISLLEAKMASKNSKHIIPNELLNQETLINN